MKNKILIFIDSGLTHFWIAKLMQKKLDMDFFAIAAVDDNAKKFLQNQKLVLFKKLWFYPDTILNKNKDIDFLYLTNFEKSYNLNIWKIALGDRRFHNEFNKFYNFSRKEILLIMEQACKFFVPIIEEISPDYLMIKDPFAHNDNLLYEIFKNKGVNILCMYPSRLGYRYIISQKVDQMDSLNINLENSYSSFDDLQRYLSKFDSFQVAKEMTVMPIIPKLKKIKPAIKFLFLKNENFKNHYVNYGKTKWNVLTRGSGRSYYREKKQIEIFLNQKSLQRIPEAVDFVFFPLHMEPERSLLVDCPYYSNQLEIIKKISRSIPINYKLFVKDHPAMKLVGWRTKSYYQQILDLPNVGLLHYSINPKEIYKKCSLVITINGTSSLEANFYGKPSIVFSNIDFSEIPSIIKVNDLEDLPKLIKNGLETKVDPVDVGKYLTKLEKNSFKFDLEGITKNFLRRFFYPGFLGIPEYPEKQMLEFFEEYENQFDLVANEHIKKIMQHKQNINKNISEGKVEYKVKKNDV